MKGRRCGAWRELCVMGVVLLVYLAVTTVSGIGCPIRWATGIPCPGCGMSRALFRLLAGDLAGALRYHPLIFAMPAAVVIFLVSAGERRWQRKLRKAALAGYLAAFLAVYLCRILQADPLLHIDLSEGAVVKYFYLIKGGF